MAYTPYEGDVNVISKLATTPQERGLPTEQFKAKFDEAIKNFVAWFNSVHKGELDETLERLNKGVNYAVDEGTPNNIVVTLENPPSAYETGFGIVVKVAHANTGPCTCTITGLSAKAIKKEGGKDLEAGDISAGQLLFLEYDGTNFQVVGGLLGSHLLDNTAHGVNTKVSKSGDTMTGPLMFKRFIIAYNEFQQALDIYYL